MNVITYNKDAHAKQNSKYGEEYTVPDVLTEIKRLDELEIEFSIHIKEDGRQAIREDLEYYATHEVDDSSIDAYIQDLFSNMEGSDSLYSEISQFHTKSGHTEILHLDDKYVWFAVAKP